MTKFDLESRDVPHAASVFSLTAGVDLGLECWTPLQQPIRMSAAEVELENDIEKGMATSNVSMKLLIDTKGKRVLFAEAGKECVDFLFHILSLPVATIIQLLKAQGMEGSLPNLYQSLKSLNDAFIQPNQSKDSFLKPVSTLSNPLLALNGSVSHKPKTKSYKCTRCSADRLSHENLIWDEWDGRNLRVCPCGGSVTEIENVAAEDVGLVKGVVTYMVMDDLVIEPMSTISSITLLNKLNVMDVSTLEEKVVNLGMYEAVKLLKASLQSKNVLTDVFC